MRSSDYAPNQVGGAIQPVMNPYDIRERLHGENSSAFAATHTQELFQAFDKLLFPPKPTPRPNHRYKVMLTFPDGIEWELRSNLSFHEAMEIGSIERWTICKPWIQIDTTTEIC